MDGLIPLMSTSTAAIIAGLALVLFLGYRAALPRPLPGIPYNENAAHKLFGDVPEMMSYVTRTKRIFVSPLHDFPLFFIKQVYRTTQTHGICSAG